ncbi:hypothetical protein Defa_14360 [Desulfovibrio sp. TH_2024_36128]|uniref:Uncharacterized protein n=1 Tax=Desulfovibrio falkowii TaxID=3136602 RepID=A0ABQ0E8G8_9BACT
MESDIKTPCFSIMAFGYKKCRDSTTFMERCSYAGVVLGAIDPAIVCCVRRIPPNKETQHKNRAGAPKLSGGADAAMK